jgi:hypothetical protein
MTLLISTTLWWLAITTMVSAAAVRWQLTQQQTGSPPLQHTRTGRHRRRL